MGRSFPWLQTDRLSASAPRTVRRTRALRVKANRQFHPRDGKSTWQASLISCAPHSDELSTTLLAYTVNQNLSYRRKVLVGWTDLTYILLSSWNVLLLIRKQLNSPKAFSCVRQVYVGITWFLPVCQLSRVAIKQQIGVEPLRCKILRCVGSNPGKAPTGSANCLRRHY